MDQRMEAADCKAHFLGLRHVGDGFECAGIFDKTHGAPEAAFRIDHKILSVTSGEYFRQSQLAHGRAALGLALADMFRKYPQVFHNQRGLGKHVTIDTLQNHPASRVQGDDEAVVDQAMAVGANVADLSVQIERGRDVMFKGHIGRRI